MPLCIFLVLGSLAHADISVVDSSASKDYIFVEVDGCITPIPRSKRDDMCYVIKRVNRYCNANLSQVEDCPNNVRLGVRYE